MMSNEKLNLATQVLNLNLDKPDMHVRHKVTIRYVRDKDLVGSYKPLFQAAVQGFKSLNDVKAFTSLRDLKPWTAAWNSGL